MSIQELYTAYGKLVYNLALQYVQQVVEAEEITQDVFLAIHKSKDAFKHQSKVSTWIYRITINKCLDHLKAKKSKKRFSYMMSLFQLGENEIRLELNAFNHPGVQLEQKEAVEKIFHLMNQLPNLQKTVLILHRIEGKSLLEIAEIIEKTPKATESLLQRAKINLKIYLINNEENK